MEWIAGILAGLVAFFAAFFSFGAPAESGDRPLPLPVLLAPPEVEILFGGDMMFDRAIRIAAEEHGDDYLFSCIAETLRSADFVVANLEGPITSFNSMSTGSTVGTPENFTFTFPTSTAELLYRHNIRLVSLGNNHILNFGREGLLQTKDWLERAGVDYFGDPDVGESERVTRLMLRGIPFSFVNWSDWIPIGKPSASNGAGELGNSVVEQIGTEAGLGRIVVVYTHWGEEYVPPTERMKRLAHDFVDAGAEIVIGSHPHIVQEHEVFKDKHIYYSLGNFVFDQYWMESVREGLLLKVTFGGKGVIDVQEIPIELKRDRTVCLRNPPVSETL